MRRQSAPEGRDDGAGEAAEEPPARRAPVAPGEELTGGATAAMIADVDAAPAGAAGNLPPSQEPSRDQQGRPPDGADADRAEPPALLPATTTTGPGIEGGGGSPTAAPAEGRVLTLPPAALVLLVGPAGCGKTTFARRHFAPGEVLSSDAVRRWLTGDEADQSQNRATFAILHRAVAARLAAGRLTVVDATNVEAAARRPLVGLARRHGRPAVALVFAFPEPIVQERNRRRSRRVAPEVVTRHWRTLAAALERGALETEGFDQVVVLRDPAEVEALRVVRAPARPGPASPPAPARSHRPAGFPSSGSGRRL